MSENSTGAQVVPFFDESELAYHLEMINHLNYVLFTHADQHGMNSYVAESANYLRLMAVGVKEHFDQKKELSDGK
jgi:hypothetical protein